MATRTNGTCRYCGHLIYWKTLYGWLCDPLCNNANKN